MAQPEEMFPIKVYSEINKSLASLAKARQTCEKAGRCDIGVQPLEEAITELEAFFTSFKEEFFPSRK